MNNVDENIIKWENKFSTYLDVETKCNTMIAQINEIKNNLPKLLGNQKKDDIVFYKALIENSVFYLINSLKIRKVKLIKDLNHVWAFLDNKKQIEELNKTNFQSLLKDYIKATDEINQAKKNSTMLTWVKDDRVENISDMEGALDEILEYHLKLIHFFHSSIELEKIFFCGK
jgi:hypothetical protein